MHANNARLLMFIMNDASFSLVCMIGRWDGIGPDRPYSHSLGVFSLCGKHGDFGLRACSWSFSFDLKNMYIHQESGLADVYM